MTARADSFVILVGDDATALKALSDPVARRLAGAGWARRMSRPFLHVYAPSTLRLQITEGLDGHGVLIGDLFDKTGRALTAQERGAAGSRPLDVPGARTVVSDLWGRYVLVRRTSGQTAVLRDPSGAVDAVAWRNRGVTVIAPNAPAVLDPLLPSDIQIDWDAVGDLVRRPGGYRHRLALSGLTPIAAGQLLTIGSAGSASIQIWRPADIYRAAKGRARPDLRAAVNMAVCALAGERTWLGELSGGLDSAIVAGALEERQRRRATAWINYYVDHPEGDERGFARAVAEGHGLTLTEVRRERLTLSADRLAKSADGFRPATNDLDADYNDDIAARVSATEAWGSLTGQGGDAVFFQMPSFLVAFDELRERGWRARLSVIHRVARWTGRSLWPMSWLQAWREYVGRRTGWDHPWLEDLRGVPPAKAVQISTLATCQTFQGLAMRSAGGPCVNPLLSQPVMEAGLAMSAVDLTRGGRDRAAARMAFRDVLPPALFSRRSKGELGAFYGEAVSEKLAFLRRFLLEGELSRAGLIDPSLADDLTREALVWRGGFSRLICLALTESWVRRWKARSGSRE